MAPLHPATGCQMPLDLHWQLPIYRSVEGRCCICWEFAIPPFYAFSRSGPLLNCIPQHTAAVSDFNAALQAKEVPQSALRGAVPVEAQRKAERGTQTTSYQIAWQTCKPSERLGSMTDPQRIACILSWVPAASQRHSAALQAPKSLTDAAAHTSAATRQAQALQTLLQHPGKAAEQNLDTHPHMSFLAGSKSYGELISQCSALSARLCRSFGFTGYVLAPHFPF